MARNFQWQRTRIALLAVLAAVAGMQPPVARAQGTSLQTEIAQHEQKLSEARSHLKFKEQAEELNLLGGLFRQAGNPQKGLEVLEKALAMERRWHNRAGEAHSLNIEGRIYTDLGQVDKALDLFNQILPVWRSLGIRKGEAGTLTNMGRAYNDKGQRQPALDSLNAALPIWRELGNKSGEAGALDLLGMTYSDMGQDTGALKYYEQALPLWQAESEQPGEALTLTNMAKSYTDLGQKQRALEFFTRALALWRRIGLPQGEANALANRGVVYRQLGQYKMAIEDHQLAIPLWRAVGNKAGEAFTLNELGRVYSDMGDRTKALDCLNQALPLWRAAQNRRGEAATINNIGRAYSRMNDAEKALEFDAQSLTVWREVQDRRGQAMALGSMGRAYLDLGKPQEAQASELAALSLAKAAGDPDLEGAIETALMLGFRRQHRNEEAIFFGKDAVNAYQQIRKNIAGLDKDLQAGFAESRSVTYRVLAELLVQSDRLTEAEQVLDLLKLEELKEVVRGAAQGQEARTEPLKLTSEQRSAQAALDGQSKSVTALGELSAEYATLQAKAARTAEESERMKALEAKIEAANGEVSDFFRKTLYPQLAQKAGTQDANTLLSKEKSDVSRLQNTLAELGSGVMGIRLLLGDEHAYAIVVTAQGRKKFELAATPAQLRSKVLQVRDDLRSPASDARPHLAELYAMLVQPFGEELNALEQASAGKDHVPTLLWSLDGVMRYVPMAALYDGHRYMVERFNNVLFTPESYGHMAAKPAADSAAPRALAMGLSKSYGGLPALPGVMPELNAVVHDPAVAESHGPMEGKLLPNEQFTLAALMTELGAGKSFAVVHIASHFVAETGGGEEPFLMLGGEETGAPDGYALTLSKMEDSTISFHGTELLTLSACSTAKGDAAKDGMEMDSLGMVAQQKDAEAVMATLWDVNDASTSRLMSDFYARWVKHPDEGKAEALRQAQLAFVHGTAAREKGADERGFKSPQPVAAPRDAGYTHPFYWAPFVLTGNFR